MLQNIELQERSSILSDNMKRKLKVKTAQRNYICGCSKSYLSYPALYTHVKIKHDGIFPNGSNTKKKISRVSN